MIEQELDAVRGVVHLRPQESLKKEDFEALAREVDPVIERLGGLAGLIVEVKSFPGWESLGAMVAHFRFVRDHHRHIRRIAVVTDSGLGTVAEKLASHFVAAEIKKFGSGEVGPARAWVLGAE